MITFGCLYETRLFGKLRVFVCGEYNLGLIGTLSRVQFGINCTALVQSEFSNFVECTITLIIILLL